MSAAAWTGDRYGGQSAWPRAGTPLGLIGPSAGTPFGLIDPSAARPASGQVSVAPFAPEAAHRLTSERAVGRHGGSAESAAVTSGSSSGGTPASSALPSMIRKKTVWKSPEPYGGRPVAAKATVAPQACTSVAPLGGLPSMTSGDR